MPREHANKAICDLWMDFELSLIREFVNLKTNIHSEYYIGT